MQVSRALPQSVFNTQHQSTCAFLNRPDATRFVWQHQIDAVKGVMKQLRDSQMPNIALVVLPTGCGKTGVAVLAAYALNASRVLVITPSLKISKQIHEAFCGSQYRRCFLEERGIVQHDAVHYVCPQGTYITESAKIHQHKHDSFMVVNAHKIGGRSSVSIEDIPNDNYDLVIVDEAHHYPAPTWKTLVDHFSQSNRIFITATPEYKRRPILPQPPHPPPCFTLPRADAVFRGVIRNIDFIEVPNSGMQHGAFGQSRAEVPVCIKNDAINTSLRLAYYIYSPRLPCDSMHVVVWSLIFAHKLNRSLF